MKKLAMAFLAGALFGLGLSIGGMTRPTVVLGFLDVAGHWQPQLAFLMAAAVPTAALTYRLAWRRQRPWCEATFRQPAARRIDAQLLAGAALFGIGWGIAGYCPGPALAALVVGGPALWVWLATMLAGWWLTDRLLGR
ncbi:DUF6691 family protein [Aerosticca soli]|nr:DUF6691 family protein [Aerosticca soli]MDI3262836.1 YeeE/YedE family protein [Fulvimonas sp.]